MPIACWRGSDCWRNWMRNRVTVAGALMVAVLRLGAQDSRIDRFGAHWARISFLCASYQPHGATTLDDRVRELGKKAGATAPDSVLREYGCVEALAYLRDARGTNSRTRGSVHAGAAIGAIIPLLVR